MSLFFVTRQLADSSCFSKTLKTTKLDGFAHGCSVQRRFHFFLPFFLWFVSRGWKANFLKSANRKSVNTLAQFAIANPQIAKECQSENRVRTFS
jgi:hypothetical protein